MYYAFYATFFVKMFDSFVCYFITIFQYDVVFTYK